MSSSNNALDMSLDDLIKNNKRSGRPRNSSSSSGPGPSRRGFPNRSDNHATPYSKPVQAPWSSQDRSAFGGGGGRSSAIETGTKLRVSNLDYGVSNEDIKELFSEVGELKRCSVDYDRSGRSKGMADVVYSRRADAVLALKKYNNVQLDGKAMQIEIVVTNAASSGAMPPVINNMFGRSNGFNRSGGQGRGGVSGRSRGGGNRGRGSGRGLGRGRGEKVSAEDLDADLEKYHSESMQIN